MLLSFTSLNNNTTPDSTGCLVYLCTLNTPMCGAIGCGTYRPHPHAVAVWWKYCCLNHVRLSLQVQYRLGAKPKHLLAPASPINPKLNILRLACYYKIEMAAHRRILAYYNLVVLTTFCRQAAKTWSVLQWRGLWLPLSTEEHVHTLCGSSPD